MVEFDDELVRGSKSLAKVYERSNVASLEPIGYFKSTIWINPMKAKIEMLEKNNT